MCLTEEELEYDGKFIRECERTWSLIKGRQLNRDNTQERRSECCTCGYHRIGEN